MGKHNRVVIKQPNKKGAHQMASAMKELTSLQEDIPHVPVQPDKTAAFIWPLHLDVKQEDYSRYHTLYPSFINSHKTKAQGRRIPREAACNDPIFQEMSVVCQMLKLWHVIEPHRCYSREPYVRGRIRVRIFLPDGSLANPAIETKIKLLMTMGKLIPTLPCRRERLEREAIEQKDAEKDKALAAKQQQHQAKVKAQSTTGRNKKKKGKK
eukprot:343711_1